MAGRGPAPKDADKKHHHGVDKRTELAVGAIVVSAPPMPKGNWSARTREWYDNWCSAPQAQRFLVTDWQRLHMLVPLVESYWQEPNVRVLGEIRLNESLLGATEADRARLRWDIKPAVAPVQSAAERRDRIRLA